MLVSHIIRKLKVSKAHYTLKLVREGGGTKQYNINIFNMDDIIHPARLVTIAT